MSDPETQPAEAPPPPAEKPAPPVETMPPPPQQQPGVVEMAAMLAEARNRAAAAEKERDKYRREAEAAAAERQKMRETYARKSAVASLAASSPLDRLVVEALVKDQWTAVAGLERAQDEDDDAYVGRQVAALGEHLRAKVPNVFTAPQPPSTANAGTITRAAPTPAHFNPYAVPIEGSTTA